VQRAAPDRRTCLHPLLGPVGEVELHAKAAARLGAKLRWYRDEAG
jgi:hypothetical protein